MVADRGSKIRQKLYKQVFSPCLYKKCVVALVIVFFISAVETATACTESQFLVEHADGKPSCEDCAPCPPGQGLSHECGTHISANAMVTCVACQSGASFSSSYNTSSCLPCASCAEDQVVLQNCTPTVDVKCAKKCYSKNRYYDEVGECLPCSKCCGDGQDLVEEECQLKLGAGSNMICSFNSSANWCDKRTATPEVITTTNINTFTLTSATVSTGSSHDNPDLSKRKDFLDFTALYVAVPLLGCVPLLVIVGCVCYFRYARQKQSNPRLNSDEEMGCDSDELSSAVSLGSADGANEKFACGKVTEMEVIQRGSSEPLFRKDAEQLSCTCQMDTKKEPKLLCSLLDDENTLEEICQQLDTRVPMLGSYSFRAVAQHYGFNHYKIVSRLEKEDGGPSRALIESLAATHPDLTLEEFAKVVGEKTKRKDVPKLLREYDLAKRNV